MNRATVVIGANYGDEGKGHIVDYLVARSVAPTIVVRFNGGAQAGHTVVTPEGKRHVFSHFGSGTLASADTYLAKHFVCNPILFWHELRQLRDLDITPNVAIDPRCFVTTPYDMLINQAIEDHRGDGRHGSVGVGFGETIERNNYPGFRICYSDLASDNLKEKLRSIRDQWMKARFAQLRLRPISRDDDRLGDKFLEKFTDSCIAFYETTTMSGAEFLKGKFLVFEGAQGLALDQDSENFPHVTRSNTGLTNVLPLANLLSLQLDVIYVTRTYTTKHGAGPLPGERDPPGPVIDETNIAHPYQGMLRFAPLDIASTNDRIMNDYKQAPIGSTLRLAVNCFDYPLPPPDFKLPVRYRSTGSRRDQIKEEQTK